MSRVIPTVLAIVLLGVPLGCGETEDAGTNAQSAGPRAAVDDPGPSQAEIRAQARQRLQQRAREERIRRERTLEGIVRTFYERVSLGELEPAWAQLTPVVQRTLGGFSRWSEGYQHTTSVRPTALDVTHSDAGSATVAVTVRSSEIDACADQVDQTFQGTWQLARHDGRWLLADPSISKTAGRTPVKDYSGCPEAQIDVPDTADLPTVDPEELDDGADPLPPVSRAPPTTQDFGQGKGRVGLCSDGTLSDSIGRPGACSHHGGVP